MSKILTERHEMQMENCRCFRGSIKYGLKGEIVVNGEKYDGVMLPMGLTDEQIANAMNYISNTWGNETKNFYTAEEVEKVKKK